MITISYANFGFQNNFELEGCNYCIYYYFIYKLAILHKNRKGKLPMLSAIAVCQTVEWITNCNPYPEISVNWWLPFSPLTYLRKAVSAYCNLYDITKRKNNYLTVSANNAVTQFTDKLICMLWSWPPSCWIQDGSSQFVLQMGPLSACSHLWQP